MWERGGAAPPKSAVSTRRLLIGQTSCIWVSVYRHLIFSRRVICRIAKRGIVAFFKTFLYLARFICALFACKCSFWWWITAKNLRWSLVFPVCYSISALVRWQKHLIKSLCLFLPNILTGFCVSLSVFVLSLVPTPVPVCFRVAYGLRGGGRIPLISPGKLHPAANPHLLALCFRTSRFSLFLIFMVCDLIDRPLLIISQYSVTGQSDAAKLDSLIWRTLFPFFLFLSSCFHSGFSVILDSGLFFCFFYDNWVWVCFSFWPWGWAAFMLNRFLRHKPAGLCGLRLYDVGASRESNERNRTHCVTSSYC